jgi:hypothetical protein
MQFARNLRPFSLDQIHGRGEGKLPKREPKRKCQCISIVGSYRRDDRENSQYQQTQKRKLDTFGVAVHSAIQNINIDKALRRPVDAIAAGSRASGVYHLEDAVNFDSLTSAFAARPNSGTGMRYGRSTELVWSQREPHGLSQRPTLNKRDAPNLVVGHERTRRNGAPMLFSNGPRLTHHAQAAPKH